MFAYENILLFLSLPFCENFFQYGDTLIHGRGKEGKNDHTHHDPIQLENLTAINDQET